MWSQIQMMRLSLRSFTLMAIFSIAMIQDAISQGILTSDEQRWLMENQSRIVMAVETGYAPFMFLDAHSQPMGLAYDYIRLIETKIGFEFKQMRFSSLNDIFEKVRNGEVQIVNAVTETPARNQFLTFTNAFIVVPNVILARKDYSGPVHEENLSGLTVSLVRSYAVTEYLRKKGLVPASDLVSDDFTALLNVSFGRSDAAVIDLATASYLISKNGITNLQVVGEIAFDIRLAIATPINELILYGILQKGLSAITDGERQKIQKRWINISNQNMLFDWRFLIVVGCVFLVILITIAFVSIWNRMLRRQVKERTNELEKERLHLEQRVRERTNELTKSEFRFRAIINASPIPEALNDNHGNILFLNPSFIRTFGYELEDISTLEAWWHKAYPDSVYRSWVEKTWESHLKKAKCNNTPFEPMELNIRCKNGQSRTTLVAASPLDDAFGEIHLVTLFDITERKQTEIALKRQMDELERFNRAMVGRELQMIALKREINELCQAGGLPARYRIVSRSSNVIDASVSL